MHSATQTRNADASREMARAERPSHRASDRRAAIATYPDVEPTEPVRVRGRSLEIPPYLVLLRVGFALPAALLPRRCAFTAPFHPYPGVVLSPCSFTGTHNDAGAVYFLWHFPSTRLEPGLPDVIRPTALRSSDFPP